MGEKLFPQFLNEGSKGPAVAVLQLMLRAAWYDGDDEVVVNGEYDSATAKAVEQFQRHAGIDADGNFGPITRAAWFKEIGIDVNSLLAETFAGKTVAATPS